MRKVISFVLILGCLMSLVGCSGKEDVQILTDKVSIENYLTTVEEVANDLYNTSNSTTRFSVVGSASDKARTNYVYEKFTEIGLKNVKKVPIMLNSWNFNGVSLISNCNCGDNSDVTMRIMGSYPKSFEYEDTKYILHRIADESEIIRENIEGFAVLVPIYENMDKLEEMVNKIAVYNPTVIVCNTTHTTIPNLYNVDTNYFNELECPVFILPNTSYAKINRYFNNSDNGLEITLNGSSFVSDESGPALKV